MKRKFVKVMFFGALALSTVTYVGCKDYDDDIDNLQTQIDANAAGLAELQAKVNAGNWVTDIKSITGGFEITFNNGKVPITLVALKLKVELSLLHLCFL